MFSFRRKNAYPRLTAPSSGCIAPDITPAVTPAVNPVMTPPITPPVTPDLASAIASTIASSLIIAMWVDGPKPFPLRETKPGATMQVWPVDAMPVKHPTAEQIAKELYTALQRNCAGHWLLALSIEHVIFPAVCQELKWPRRSWKGKDGVAAHPELPAPEYKRAEIEGGKLRKLQHYFIPYPQSVTVAQLTRRTA